MSVDTRIARAIHLLAAFWTLCLAVLIFFDVMGLKFFGRPVPGTKEIIQNSVVAITFLQIPLAIYSGSMLRTSILADSVPPFVQKLLRTFMSVLGFVVFMTILWSTWPAFFDAYRIGEYEGEGSLRVPTWPVRGTVLVMSAFAAWAYLTMIWHDWRGNLVNGQAAPGAYMGGEE
jgi:TRAP-type C4-dicarboxylate transport system permease small subunit